MPSWLSGGQNNETAPAPSVLESSTTNGRALEQMCGPPVPGLTDRRSRCKVCRLLKMQLLEVAWRLQAGPVRNIQAEYKVAGLRRSG